MERKNESAPPAAAADPEPDEGVAESFDPTDLLDLVLAEHAARTAPARIDGVLVGRLVGAGTPGAGPEGESPRVEFTDSPEGGVAARAMVALGPGDVGREVAILFEGGDPSRPVVMGLMHAAAAPTAAAPAVDRDGERLVFTAEREIVLRCGDASITLTRAGKILIRGAYVLTRSSGVNRIQGGSVQIN